MSNSNIISTLEVFVGDSTFTNLVNISLSIGNTQKASDASITEIKSVSPDRVLITLDRPTTETQALNIAHFVQQAFIEHQMRSFWGDLINQETSKGLPLTTLINRVNHLISMATLIQNPDNPSHPHPQLTKILSTSYSNWYSAVLQHLDDASLERFRSEYTATLNVLGSKSDIGIRAFIHAPLRPNIALNLPSRENLEANHPMFSSMFRRYQYDYKLHFCDRITRQAEVLQEFLIRQKPLPPATATTQSESVASHHSDTSIHYVIITALPEECAAALELVKSPKRRTINDQTNPSYRLVYHSARVAPDGSSSGEHNVAIFMLSDMGNNSAAAQIPQLARAFTSAKQFIMCGIAGGNPNMPGKPLRLGDIFVSDKPGILQYDNIKHQESGIEVRSPPRPPSVALLNAHRRLKMLAMRGESHWQATLFQAAESNPFFSRPDTQNLQPITHGRNHSNTPDVHDGVVGSANTLLKDASRRDELFQKYKIGAIEMEGSGVADAAHLTGRDYFIVRGICDYCDANKDDSWHNFAALAAAAYTYALILEDFGPED